MNWWQKFVPVKDFSWWQLLAPAVVFAVMLAALARQFYASRSQGVPDDVVAVFGVAFAVAFMLVGGIDRRLPERARGIAGAAGLGLFLGTAVLGGLATIVY